MKTTFLIGFLYLFALAAFGQPTGAVHISVEAAFKHKNMVLKDSIYKLENGNLLNFEHIKFYISNIQFYKDEMLVFSEKNSFHLIDFTDTASLNKAIKTPKTLRFNRLKFDIGIDSITNMAGARGGDLDPTKGMYWTWQSGYINVKMEGSCSNCRSKNRDFEFHLGGYQSPFYPLQTVTLATKGQKNLRLAVNIEQFFKKIDLSKQKNIMSPSAEAVRLSRYFAECFELK